MKLTEKAEWKKQPQNMLVARCTGELSRLIASDALHGMPYVSEELEGTTTGEVLPPKKAPLSVAALTAPAPEPQPAAEPAYSVARDDQPAAGDWDQDAIDDSTDWTTEQ